MGGGIRTQLAKIRGKRQTYFTTTDRLIEILSMNGMPSTMVYGDL